MNKYITLSGLCLLLTSTHIFAETPVADDQFELIEPEIEEILISDIDSPIIEELPATETETTAEEEIIEIEEISTLEVDNNPEQEVEPVVIDTAPVVEQPNTSAETQVSGDVLQMQPDETLPVRVLDFPRRGMSMEKVKNELGDPLEISETIGKPPITSWSYNDRIVYFEYSRVVHVVNIH